MPRWPELVIFDNNGTLFDDLHVAFGSVRAIFAVLNLPCPTQEEYRNEIGADFMQFYWSHGVPREIGGDQLNVIRKLYYRQRLGAAHYRPDCAATIKCLIGRGASVAVCSAEIEETLRASLSAAGLYDLFAPGTVRGQAWPKKAPHLRALADWLGIAPRHTVYVDDTVDGIQAADEAGIRAVGFCNPTGYNTSDRIRAARPDAIIRSISEVLNLTF